ncbi:hypothetical protein pb186bvf_010194 [Paramecium bursaria]
MDILFTILLGQQNPFSQNIDLVTVIEDDETNSEALQIQDQFQTYSCYYCGINSTLESLRKHHREISVIFGLNTSSIWLCIKRLLIMSSQKIELQMTKAKEISSYIKIPEDEQIIDLIKINDNEEQQVGFLEEKMINKPQQQMYRRSARNAGKAPKSYNTEQNEVSEQSEGDELKVLHISENQKIYYGKPKAQRKPLQRYSYTQNQNIEFNDVQGQGCFCQECTRNKKALIAEKVQNKSIKLNQIETKDGNEVMNQTEQCTNQQSEQAVISKKANTEQSSKAIRHYCQLCPDKSYSRESNLKRHFTQKHNQMIKKNVKTEN